MKLIKMLLLLVLFVAVAAGAFHVLANRGIIPPEQAQAVYGTWNTTLQPLIAAGLPAQIALPSQISVPEQVSSLAETSGAVLGTSSLQNQVQAEQPPLPQRAFEYGRYVYCQEVIKDYQSRFPQD